jgi:hypothetical protein
MTGIFDGQALVVDSLRAIVEGGGMSRSNKVTTRRKGVPSPNVYQRDSGCLSNFVPRSGPAIVKDGV